MKDGASMESSQSAGTLSSLPRSFFIDISRLEKPRAQRPLRRKLAMLHFDANPTQKSDGLETLDSGM